MARMHGITPADEYISGYQYRWDYGASVDTISDTLYTENAIFDERNFSFPISHHQNTDAVTHPSTQASHAPPFSFQEVSESIISSPFQSISSEDPYTLPSYPQNNPTPPSPQPTSSRQRNSKQKFLCWDHGCNGSAFSSKSNLDRHRKERGASGATTAQATCPLCGALFTRNSARDTHLAKQSCNRIRRYSNGRCRPSKLAMLGSPAVAGSGAGLQRYAPLGIGTAGRGAEGSQRGGAVWTSRTGS